MSFSIQSTKLHFNPSTKIPILVFIVFQVPYIIEFVSNPNIYTEIFFRNLFLLATSIPSFTQSQTILIPLIWPFCSYINVRRRKKSVQRSLKPRRNLLHEQLATVIIHDARVQKSYLQLAIRP